VKAGIAKGRAPESWYFEQPHVDEMGAWVLASFRRLSTCRSYGMSPGPIPWRDVDAYATRQGLPPGLARAFDRMIEALDWAYLDWMATERKRNAEKPPPPPPDKE
jgi:hypothetical protein